MNNRFRIQICDNGYEVLDTKLYTVTSPNGVAVLSHAISKDHPMFEANVKQAMKLYNITEVAA